MLRLIGILAVLLAGIGLVSWLSRQTRRRQDAARADKTFRPRPTSASSSSSHESQQSGSNYGSANDIYMMSKSSVSAVCDALTGAAIDQQASIWRCVKCSSLYNQRSVTALEKDNAGACVQCNSKVRALVTLTDD